MATKSYGSRGETKKSSSWLQNLASWFAKILKPVNHVSGVMSGAQGSDFFGSGSDFGQGVDDTSGFGSSFDGLFDALIARLVGNHLTGAQREANEFSALEAQKGRDFTEYMTRNKYQMETESMESAGVNPAMVYGGGNLVSTASNPGNATSVSPGEGLNPFDAIMSIVRLKRELGIMDAQKENLLADSEKKRADAKKSSSETDFIELQKKYYPKVTDKQIEKFDSEIGVNNQTKENLVSEKSLTDAKKVLQDFENKYADQYYNLRNLFTEAETGREHSRERLNDMQTALYRIEKDYMDKYGMKMGTSEAYSICMALLDAFGASPDSLVSKLRQIGQELPDGFKNLINYYKQPPHDGGSVGGGSR